MKSKLRQFAEWMRDPMTTSRHINRRIHTRNGRYEFNPSGTAIFDEDWDNLIVLDACRYDAFKEQVDLPGRLESRESLGPATYRWVRGNFADRKLYDTVYVGANTWYLKLRDEINSDIHAFIDLQNDVDDVNWVSEKLRVVTPDTVTKKTKRVSEAYPNKRLIIHYLQPHHPFIGPTSEKYFDHRSDSLFEVVRSSGPEVTAKKVWKAYNETLNIVLEEISVLLSDLEGKTVVTADHGEMIGDRHDYLPTKDYGHHRGIYNDPTIKVPWQVIESGSRKEIQAEKSDSKDTDMVRIDKQLRDLGYKL